MEKGHTLFLAVVTYLRPSSSPVPWYYRNYFIGAGMMDRYTDARTDRPVMDLHDTI